MQLLQRLIGEQIVLSLVCPDGPTMVDADAGMIDHVLINLAVNARDAMPNGGLLSITVERCEAHTSVGHSPEASRPMCHIAVVDTGTWIDAAILPRVFEPFFTTKEVGKGTRLGLATAYGIVQQHGGHMEVSSRGGAGTRFDVYLPRVCSPAQADAPEVPHPAAGGRERVLVVEDEPALRTRRGPGPDSGVPRIAFARRGRYPDHGLQPAPTGQRERAWPRSCWTGPVAMSSPGRGGQSLRRGPVAAPRRVATCGSRSEPGGSMATISCKRSSECGAFGRAVQLAFLGVLLTGIFACLGGDTHGKHEDGALHLTVAALADDVNAIHLVVQRVHCDGGRSVGSAYEATEQVLPGRLPAGFPALTGRPLAATSKHAFAEHFRSLQAGCYNVTTIPWGGDADCEEAHKKKVRVLAGRTTEVTLINQCAGQDKGAIDVISLINHAPTVERVRLEEGKFVCGTHTEVCVLASDPDADPLEIELVSGTDHCTVGAASEPAGTPAAGVQQCFDVMCPAPGRVNLTARVFDLAYREEEPIRIEDWLALEGYPNTSRGELAFHAYLVCEDGDSAPEFVLVSGSMSVGEGAQVSLRCEASGTPEPSYQWYGPQGPLTEGTSTTLAFTVTLEDAGEYYCVAENALGTAVSGLIELQVLPPPEELADADGDGIPDVVEDLTGSDPDDNGSQPVGLALPSEWRNDPRLKVQRSYDFSALPGYSSRSAVPVTIEKGTIVSAHVPLLQAVDALDPGMPDPDAVLPTAERLGAVFDVQATVGAGRQALIPIPLPDAHWVPLQALKVLHYTGTGWEQAEIAFASRDAVYVVADSFSLFVAYDAGGILFVGDWPPPAVDGPPASKTFLTSSFPAPSGVGTFALSHALLAARNRNLSPDPANHVHTVWITEGTYVPLYPAQQSEQERRIATFSVPPDMHLIGGFPGTSVGPYITASDGGLLYVPDSKRWESVLSGDLKGDDGLQCGFTDPAFICDVVGNADNVYHVLRHDAGGALDLQGLTIRGGFASDSINPLRCGGGLYTTGATNVRIEDCRFERNTAVSGGGAIYSDAANLIVLDSAFELNHAVTIAPPDPTVPYGEGGAIHVADASGDALIQRCEFRRNTGRDGAAVFARGANAGAHTLTLTNTVLTENVSEHGAIAIDGFTLAASSGTAAFNYAFGEPNIVRLQSAPGSTVEHYIMWSNDSLAGSPLVGSDVAADLSHSLIEGGAASLSGLFNYGTGNLDQAPTFADPAGRNVRLVEGSAGIDIDPAYPNYVGGAKDAGAYEFMYLMPLGDSNTEGGYGAPVNGDQVPTRQAYRDDLYQDVGVINIGSGSPHPRSTGLAHMGFAGQTIARIKGKYDLFMDPAAGNPTPDVILLCAGTNDVRDDIYSGPRRDDFPDDEAYVAAAMANLKGLVDSIRDDPRTHDAWLLVATVPPFTNGDGWASPTAFASRFDRIFNYEIDAITMDDRLLLPAPLQSAPFLGIQGLVEYRQALGDTRIAFVDVAGAMTGSAYGLANVASPDGIHANGIGYSEIASAWLAAIRASTPTAW